MLSYAPVRRTILGWVRRAESFEIPARAKREALVASLVEQDRDGEVVERLHKILVGSQKHKTFHEALQRASEDPEFGCYLERITQVRETLLRARSRFVSGNLGLVVLLAKRYSDRLLSLGDRVQEGNLGLLKAVERFDPERGTRFSTYAAWWIRHSITRALVNRGRKIRIPAHLHVIFNKSRAVESKLQAELMREPTDSELADAIELPVDKVRDAREAMRLRSVALETPAWGDEGGTVADQLQAELGLDVDDSIDDRRNYIIAHEGMDGLEAVERDILEHRFALQGSERLTLRALGERHRLSRERIRQLQNRGLTKLRNAIESSDLPSIALSRAQIAATDGLMSTGF